jgi:hypothetical protein
MAFTKYVQRKGKGTQNHSGFTTKNPKVTTNEIIVYNQYIFTDSAPAVMLSDVI